MRWDSVIAVASFIVIIGAITGCSSVTTEVRNSAPVISSTAVATATEDQVYSYDVEATDADTNDGLTFSLDESPAGMTINSTTGMIQWAPGNSDVGDNSVIVRVQDSGSLSDTQSFTVTVTNVNDAPEITSSAVTTATEDQTYSYDADATDIDTGDTVTFSLETSPTGMTINSTTGVIQWTPGNSDVGDHSVGVRVQDASGLTGTQDFTITVANVNDAPEITSSAVTSATEDQAYSYDVDATDIDVGDTFTYSLSQLPTGMTINSSTGVIQWVPNDSHVGDNSVTVQVEDSEGSSDTQSFTITVTGVVGKYAVIVGVSNYKSFSDLSYCDEDANSWYDYLIDEGYTCWLYGDNTSSYSDFDGIATENNVRDAIQDMLSLVDANDKVVLVLSGHGAGDGEGDSCVCLWDCTSGEDGYDGYYTDTELAGDFEDCAAAQLLVFIDTCYSGGMNEVASSPNIGHVYFTSTCTEYGYGWDVNDYQHGAWTYFFLVWGLEGSGHAGWDMATCYSEAYDQYETYYSGNMNGSGWDWGGPCSYDHPVESDSQSGSLFYV